MCGRGELGSSHVLSGKDPPTGTSLAVQWLKLHLPMQRVQVRSLVGELRSYMSHSQKKQNIKQKQYCDKFNKDLKKKKRIHLPMQEMLETLVQPLGWENPLEEEMATHSSILAWEIPWTEEPGGIQSMGSQRVGLN